MFVLLLAAQWIAPPGKPFPAPPIGPAVSSLFTADDYPPQARMNHWEGVVGIKLTIGTAGRVTDCKVIQSSGYQVLDDTTCKIVIKRARFKPARDSSGNAAVAEMTGPQIIWRYSP